jgi:2-dehydro-3-deoxyphosphogluconate aldolase/(4S)-4-hydroxy-2-oxoglutarate aldolase
MDVKKFKQLPILGILRGIEPDILEPLLSAIDSAGLKTIEITMNTKGAAELIRKAVTLSKECLTIGAGTVLDMRSLKLALDAGATFIVMPVLILEVMKYCTKNRIPVFPGALTPQEIYTAWRAGATIVKVFPSNFFGPEYFKEIKGPFNDVELMACGGVTPQNLKNYFANGVSAVSFGASVFKKEWLSQKDFFSITQSIKKYIQEYREGPHPSARKNISIGKL